MKGRFMRRSIHWTLILGVLLALTLGVAACGGDDHDGGEQGTTQGTPAEGKKGGKLTALWAGDVDFIDPGQGYYQMSLQINRTTQSMLYMPKVDDPTVVEPLLAESDPQISADGCTVTVKIKDGVKFSPPVNRAVTSADVKYAIERGFFNTVNNGYAGAYFGEVKGSKVGVEPGTEISGIETPDDSTIVFNLKTRTAGKCAGGVVAGALVMPLTAPVPKDYAAKFDAKNPSTYGQNQVSTGPYMVQNDASGKATGYEAGKYEGNETFSMVGDNEGVGAKTAEVAAEQFERLGIHVRLRQVTHDAMYTKYCNVPSAKIAICPNVGWLKDFGDPQTYLDPTFNGENIIPQNNSNWSELDVPEINKAMNDAKVLTEPSERGQAWADIDKMVTEQAPAVNWIWDKNPNIESSNVQGVIDVDNA